MNIGNKINSGRILSCYSNVELEKSEGSRGGKVIGHTRMGHPIYEEHQPVVDYAKEKGYEINTAAKIKGKGIIFGITHNDKEDTSGLNYADQSKDRTRVVEKELKEKFKDTHEVQNHGGTRRIDSMIGIKKIK